MNALLADIDAGLASDVSAARVVGMRYEPIASAGAGEATWRALDRLTGQVVTLAWVGHRASSGDPISHSRYAREFERIASLRHPNLARVLDFGLDQEGRAYFVLGLREQPVALLDAARDAPRAIRLNWLVQLLRALAYLHRCGLAHGDLSPANIGIVAGRVVVSPLGAGAVESSTITRDLQSVGVMSYQLFGGRLTVAGTAHPRGFDVSTLEVEPRVAAVIARVIAGDWGERFRSAADVVAALSDALGQPIAMDDMETRESFLQAGRLVGRETEVATLREELDRALGGRGDAWLVGGESGVGKSRLLDELWALARARGALVFRGQEEREGGSPYRLWQGALRWLAVAADVSEHEASVLLPVVPDLPRLLGRDVAPPPHLDPPSAHARLVEVVVGMLTRQTQPMVLLLEDVHWARSDSIKLLQVVTGVALDLPLLVACTFRDDERPDLPAELPSTGLLELRRLRSSEIASLGESIVGPEGRRPDVVAFLERETEGNPFFLVEVVRALAEEAGSLNRIGMSALPERVFAGGVRRVVERRLRDLPPEARPSLRAAAVIGRNIDVTLLRALAPSADIDVLLEQCVRAAVLDRREGVLRFSHDRIREGVLLEVDETERRALHARVAAVIEQLHGDAPGQGAALAHHWGAAGERAKEALYAALAGEQAVEGGARAEGMALLNRALALRNAETADPVERAHLHRVLSDSAFEAGEFTRAFEHAVESLALLGVRVPTTRAGWALMAVGRLAVFLWLLVTPRRRPSDDARTRRLVELSRAASRLALVRVYQLDTIPVLALSLAAADAARSAGRTEVHALGVLGFAAGTAGLGWLARRCFASGRAAAVEQHDEASLIDLDVMEAAFLVGVGEFDRAREQMIPCVARAERLGYRFGGASAESVLARCDAMTGYYDEMLAHYERSAELLRAYAPEHRLGQVAGVAKALATLGRGDEARALIAECAGTFESRLVRLSVTTLSGFVHARTGDLAKARTEMDEATTLVGREHAYPAPVLELLEIPGEVYVAAWWRARETAQAEVVLESAARKRLAALRAWARLWPIGAPAASILAGDIHELRGDTAAACREWRRAVALAEPRGMRPYAARAAASLRRASQSSAT
jgi:eukaryotic-like serine/threonine-protein kinase